MSLLRSVGVANYRAFVDRAELELRPLTLVFGQNNSGKSALVRLLPWLADSVSPESSGPLDLASRAVRGAPFAEIHTRPPLSSRPEIDVSLAWVVDGSTVQFEASIRSFPDLRRDLVKEFQVVGGPSPDLKGELVEEFERTSKSLPYRLEQGEQTGAGRIRFHGLIPKLEQSPPSSAWGERLDQVGDCLCDFGTSVQWLGSVRSLPDREVAFWGEEPSLITPEGLGTVELLVADHLRERKLLPAVSAWLEQNLDLRLDIEPRLDRFAVMLSPRAEPKLRINLLDTGEGITQVLPILVAIERARLGLSRRRLLALEQPELHLHPAAQWALGDYLCEVAAEQKDLALVVETHSQSLLLSLQLAVMEGRLPPEAVAVYWIRRLSDGRSRAELLPLDKAAHPVGWPPEVFGERLEQSRRLVLSRRRLGAV
ncbi:MAG TPA: AAA family ATPase [Thermoanaerobaculia bacterium]|nr:AAA family ATPase [Thermoanaerobaculia bacterium]